jgi:hypothetical protein
MSAEGVPDPAYWVTGTQLLLKYLKADDIEKRTQYALEFARRESVPETWLQDVGKRLVREEAERKRCAPLTLSFRGLLLRLPAVEDGHLAVG